ncbi:uncharacterized protein LOC108475147 [Gossypium arboreum]|uniref:uncharacterized protein LOC108475147 n=1 Tax=Gossypium arboreum TaxID=29729 RepID=UPI0022F1BDEF|nr:uncharacterized protein LOC108475147 [Gossypium arboreum]
MMQERNQAQQPSPSTAPSVAPPVVPPPHSVTESKKRTLIENLRKFRAEEFWGRSDDDPVKAEYWLQNTVRVFEEMACSLDDYLKCVFSLLKKEAYNWWMTIVAVAPKDKITWEFFQSEFKKKYVSKRYLNKKKREFLDLRQGLNDEIRMMIGGIEIREFIVLSVRAQKMEEVYNRKMQWERRNKEFYKRSSSKSFSAYPAKKFRDDSSRPTSMLERSSKNKVTQ